MIDGGLSKFGWTVIELEMKKLVCDFLKKVRRFVKMDVFLEELGNLLK